MTKRKKSYDLDPPQLKRLRMLALASCTTPSKQERREDLRWLLAEYDKLAAAVNRALESF